MNGALPFSNHDGLLGPDVSFQNLDAPVFSDQVGTVGRIEIAQANSAVDKLDLDMLSANRWVIDINMPLPADYVSLALHGCDCYLLARSHL